MWTFIINLTAQGTVIDSSLTFTRYTVDDTSSRAGNITRERSDASPLYATTDNFARIGILFLYIRRRNRETRQPKLQRVGGLTIFPEDERNTIDFCFSTHLTLMCPRLLLPNIQITPLIKNRTVTASEFRMRRSYTRPFSVPRKKRVDSSTRIMKKASQFSTIAECWKNVTKTILQKRRLKPTD